MLPEIIYTRKYRKRPNKVQRSSRKLARMFKQEGPVVLGSNIDNSHPFFFKAKAVQISYWDIERWHHRRESRLRDGHRRYFQECCQC